MLDIEDKIVSPAAPSRPPGPGPFYGQLPFFLRRTLGLIQKARFRYDDVIRFRGAGNTYLLSNPDDINHVLVTNASNYIKTPHLTSKQGKRRAGDGLLTRVGAEHAKQRGVLQPDFRHHSISSYADVIIDRTQKKMAGWQDGEIVDVAREMETLSQSIILGMLFGIDLQDPGNTLATAINTRRKFTEYVYHSKLPYREVLPTRMVRNNKRAIRTIDDFIYAQIEKRLESGPANDMLSRLMQVTYPDGSKMDRRLIRDEVLTLTSTGYETIGEALTWTFYLLAQHPQVEKQLQFELDTVLNGKIPAPDDLRKLRYAEMVFLESLRLYPPTWIYVRVPLENDVLPSGAKIPARSKLYLCQYIMHRHPRYFPNPERFEPERFRDPVERHHVRNVYFPFGAGPHKCIGEMFAKLQGVLVMALVAKKFSFERPSQKRLTPFAGITLRPKKGLKLRLHAR